MKVLLVDDSSTMRRIQKNQLATIGINEIVEAGDGAEALKKLESESSAINMVLLDWNMPTMDGLTFLKKVRQNDTFKNIKIIMCTSESEKPRVMEALQAGANNYIVKPFTADILKEKLGM